MPLHQLAVNDKVWAGQAAPDAGQFCPERLLTGKGLEPGNLMPFGHGPRCAYIISVQNALLYLLAVGVM